MRLITWNLNRATWQQRGHCKSADEHQRRAWEELGALGVDVAFLQEAMPPPLELSRPPLATLPAGVEREDWRSLPGPSRWWCSALATWTRDLAPFPTEADALEPLEETHKGAYRLGQVPFGEGRLIVASIYALWDYAGLRKGEKPRYSETSLHRTLSDLTPIIDVHRTAFSVVVAGDFNASTQFGRPDREPYGLIHARLRSLGLVNVTVSASDDRLENCICADDPCEHVRSLEGPTPYQDDYIYASPDIAERTTRVTVERSPGIEAVSDHFPLVVEVEPT